MTRIRAAARRLADVIAWPYRHPRAWWDDLEPPERVFYRGIGFIVLGVAPWSLQAAAIIAGVVMLLFFFGFSFKRGA